MFTPWISFSGSIDEVALDSSFPVWSVEYSYFVAFLTDGMLSGRAAQLDALRNNVSCLLELRLFDCRHELWLYRSALGLPFSWRVADDEHTDASLTSEGLTGFFGDPSNYMQSCVQKLDINRNAPPKGQPKLEGNRLLRNTGGGIYELPVDDEDAIRLVRYISYDSSGSARIADFRMAEFTRISVKKEEN